MEEWLNGHIPHCIAVAASVAATYFKANHVIDAAKDICHKSVWGVVKAALTGAPIKVPAVTGGVSMLNLQHMKQYADELEQTVERITVAIARFTEITAPVAQVVGTATGHPEVAAAAGIAEKVADGVLAANQTAPDTPVLRPAVPQE